MHIAAQYSAKVASSLAAVLLTYLILAPGGGPATTASYEEPLFDLAEVESNAWLQAMPPPSSDPYDGMGNPTVVVTHHRPGGELRGILHSAEVWTTTPGGVDLCNDEWFHLDAFYVAAPAGGATSQDENVTYVSDTYQNPAQMGPGGEDCVTRASPGKTWHYRVCIEYDGALDAPRPGVFDDWDRCIEGTSTPSSPTGALPAHGFP